MPTNKVPVFKSAVEEHFERDSHQLKAKARLHRLSQPNLHTFFGGLQAVFINLLQHFELIMLLCIYRYWRNWGGINMISLSFIPLILAICQHASKCNPINEMRPCKACKQANFIQWWNHEGE